MINFSVIIIVAVSIWVFIYTASYALWTWKRNNKLGGAALFVIALIVLVYPIYLTLIRA